MAKKAVNKSGSQTKVVVLAPPNEAAAEVVAFAKSQGIDISNADVSTPPRVVSKPVNTEPVGDKSPNKSASKHSPPEPKVARKPKQAKTGSKTAYVLTLPGLSAREVVRRAQAVGMVLTDKYVYKVRSIHAAKAKKKQRTHETRPHEPQATAVEARSGKPSNPESQLIHAALDLGLARAEELLREVRRKLTTLS
jgi:hypothetical protein